MPARSGGAAAGRVQYPRRADERPCTGEGRGKQEQEGAMPATSRPSTGERPQAEEGIGRRRARVKREPAVRTGNAASGYRFKKAGQHNEAK